MVATTPTVRLTGVLAALDIAASSWYRKPVPEDQRRRPGPAPKPIPDQIVGAVVKMARDNPWYGYKRIAVMCRRHEIAVTDRQAYQLEMAREEAERIGGPLAKKPFVVTDNGPSFIARRFGAYIKEL